MALQLVHQRLLVVLHVIDVHGAVLAARAHATRLAGLLAHRPCQRTEGAPDRLLGLLDAHAPAQAERVLVAAVEAVGEKVVGLAVDEEDGREAVEFLREVLEANARY